MTKVMPYQDWLKTKSSRDITKSIELALEKASQQQPNGWAAVPLGHPQVYRPKGKP